MNVFVVVVSITPPHRQPDVVFGVTLPSIRIRPLNSFKQMKVDCPTGNSRCVRLTVSCFRAVSSRGRVPGRITTESRFRVV